MYGDYFIVLMLKGTRWYTRTIQDYRSNIVGSCKNNSKNKNVKFKNFGDRKTKIE
jgi:hypothetical protein